MPFLCPSKSNELYRSIAAQVPIATTRRLLGFNISFDGDVGLDRTPHGVRSPVAHRTINKSSVAGAGFNYRVSVPPPHFCPHSHPPTVKFQLFVLCFPRFFRSPRNSCSVAALQQVTTLWPVQNKESESSVEAGTML